MTVYLDGMNADFMARFNLAIAEVKDQLGYGTSIRSAFRPRWLQQQLWDGWQAKLAHPGDPRYAHFNLAARPGFSNHERGLAIDMHPNSSPLSRPIFAKYGLHFPVNGEPWHVEPMWVRGFLMPPLPANAPTAIKENDLMVTLNEIQMTQLKAHMEHVVLNVLDDRWLAEGGALDKIADRIETNVLRAVVTAMSKEA